MSFHKCVLFVFLCFFLALCKPSVKELNEAKLKSIIKAEIEQADNPDNGFSPQSKLVFLDSVLKQADALTTLRVNYERAKVYMQLGDISKTIQLYEAIGKAPALRRSDLDSNALQVDLAFAYLRMGEVNNCLTNHTAESCIYPIQGGGLHKDPAGSSKAIALYEKILERDPDDIESRWLMNIAYMTLGMYPDRVPEKYLLKSPYPETDKVIPFEDIAASLKINVNNQVGSVITEDFDNDGYLDIVTCSWGLDEPMYFFKNNADGTFTDLSKKSGLSSVTAGFNLLQTDYNNDGYKDIFVLRGGWKGEFGLHHKSLLKNNGDGTFTEVTIESGLLSAFPTQTAAWNDFNNDGWLDVFVGYESFKDNLRLRYPCELYINNHDGTFTNVSETAKTDVIAFVKGVTSGDFDNDGWQDLYLSAMDGKRILLRNKGVSGKIPVFEDVTVKARLDENKTSSFVTWFWDYDNDGWLDILAGNYSFERTLAYYAAAECLKMPMESIGQPMLYHNNADGTFTEVTKSAGLFRSAFAMGSNFGDIDNDGFLDMYLGTGNPNFESLVPNKMFRNINGKEFSDVTQSARVGSLQKGHGVAFADMDNDGDQDIYIEMGGAFAGDAYPSSFFLNPGQNKNNWVNIVLEGSSSNKAAIGTRVKLTVTENGRTRYIYRDVNSGGSFGASPLRREIGIGSASGIDELEIRWHGSGKVQTFKNVPSNQFIRIKEGSGAIEKMKLKHLNFRKDLSGPHRHHAMNR